MAFSIQIRVARAVAAACRYIKWISPWLAIGNGYVRRGQAAQPVHHAEGAMLSGCAATGPGQHYQQTGEVLPGEPLWE